MSGKIKFAVIGGGRNNCVTDTYGCSTIAGGDANRIVGYGLAAIGGGQSNCHNNACRSFIGGGNNNLVLNSFNAVIGGGTNNLVDNGSCSSVLGGNLNKICDARCSSISGGYNNCIDGQGYTCNFNFIGGGYQNKIYKSTCSGILGGYNNLISQKNNSYIIGCGITAGANSTTYTRNLCVVGTLTKSGGSFSINHPDPLKTKTHNLVHGFVESATAGDNIYRYTIEVSNLTATIELPGYYKFLNENDQVWVNGKNHFGKAYGVVNDKQTKLNIFADTDGVYNVLLIGTRKDSYVKEFWKGVEPLKTEGELEAQAIDATRNPDGSLPD